MFWGALVVAGGCVAFTLVAGLVNALWYRDLPVAVDPIGLLTGALTLGAAGAVVGALTMRSESVAAGVLTGAGAIGLLTALSLLSNVLGGGEVLAFIVVFPALALGLVACAALRLALNGPFSRGPLALVFVGLVGGALGLWGRMSEPEANAVRNVQRAIATYATQPAGLQRPAEFNQAPGAYAHLQLPYAVTARTVRADPETIEVVVAFEDGYTLTCRVITRVPLCSEFGTAELGGPDSDR